MTVRKVMMAALAVALTAQGGMAGAQKAKPKPTASAAAKATPARGPSEAQMKAASDTLSLFVSAFNSKDVPKETKAGLMLCLYSNPLGKISMGLTEALAAEKSIDATSPVQRLLVLATLCNAPLPAAADKAK